MRRFAWTRILSVLLVLCMLAAVVPASVLEANAERVTYAQTYTDLTWEQVQSGTYYSDEECTTAVSVTVTEGVTSYISTTTSYNQYYSKYANSGYYYKVDDSYVLITSIKCERSGSYNEYSYEWTINDTYTFSGYTITIYGKTSTATTYSLMAGSETLATSTDASDEVGVTLYASDIVEYFPVTMYNYDKDAINAATHKADIAAGLGTSWNGLYFSGGDPAATAYSEDVVIEETAVEITYSGSYAVLDDGTYVIYSSVNGCYMTGTSTGSGSSPWWTDAVIGTRTQGSASVLTITAASSNRYTVENGEGKYLDITGDSAATWSDSVNYVYFMKSGSNLVIKDADGGTYSYLNALGASDTTYYHFGGWSEGSAVTLYKATGTTTASLPFAAHNWWSKGLSDNQLGGQMVYSGLVASQLDANKDIVFNVPDAGLFSDAAVDGKTIYTGVQLPFVYDQQSKYYTFDSAVHGVYWHTDSTQGTSSTIAGNSKLYWDKNDPQAWSGMSYGDGSTNLWAPFNDGDPASSTAVDYYFGMNATIPFTMTANGRLNASNPNSDPIEFSFSGDDDVWIFIDGQLVADLGGIHNRLDVTINFATNEVTYFVSDDNVAETSDEYIAIADGNGYDADSNTTGNLFKDMTFAASTDSDGTNGKGSYTTKLFNETTTVDGTATTTTGLLNTDINTFAAKDNHELTIFYMERGAGSSNARIKFNLPVKDTLTVQKLVNKKVEVNEDKTALDMSTVTALDAAQQTVIDNLNFGFTLYKRTVNEANETVDLKVSNVTYNLLNANGQVIATPSTDANGHFYLKNGQTAKFTGELSESGDTYYVVEDVKDGFIYTTYAATANAPSFSTGDTPAEYSYFEQSGAYIITDDDVTLQSPVYTVKGSADTEDSLNIVCENYMNASLPTPSAIPNDDKFVLDFGLSAELEIFSNDLFIGENPTITFPEYTEVDGVYTGTYGTFTYADGKIAYTLNKQLTGVEVIPYTLTVSASGANDATGTANIYIMPATTMYYEENFGDLVTWDNGTSKDGWQTITASDAVSENQEPGKVGTVGDSPYGSDAAYLNDSKDSNGTSKYVNTSEGYATFSYTFTGTGTSFYARTNYNTGFMQIIIYKGDTAVRENMVFAAYRDTAYVSKDEEDNVDTDVVLYNVPVFTWNVEDGDIVNNTELSYGTYTVVVSVAKAYITPQNKTEPVQYYGYDFWLDGIRIYNPLVNNADAEAAYATDGESNMTKETLRDKLIGEYPAEDWQGKYGFVVFTDSNGEIVLASDYISNGPKEEVYLNADQSITFSLESWTAGVDKVYLGLKAPMGSGKVTVGTTTLEINNTVDCFYDISDFGSIKTEADGSKTITFTVTATEGLISATTIKVTGTPDFVIIIGEDVYVDNNEASGEDAEITDAEAEG